MTVVGVMSQPLRAPYAKAYLGTFPPETRRILLTLFPASLDMTGWSEGIEVLTPDVESKVLSSSRIVSRSRGRAARWARTSRLGTRTVRIVRKSGWRNLDRLALLLDDQRHPRPARHGDELVALLESLRGVDSFDELVVFDLFDLPAVLRFAEDKSVVVRVR